MTLFDGFKNRTECHASIRQDSLWVTFLLVAAVYGLARAIRLTSRMFHYIDIRNFYHEGKNFNIEI